MTRKDRAPKCRALTGSMTGGEKAISTLPTLSPPPSPTAVYCIPGPRALDCRVRVGLDLDHNALLNDSEDDFNLHDQWAVRDIKEGEELLCRYKSLKRKNSGDL